MDPLRIRITGPLAPHLSVFWSWLLSRGYTPLSSANQARLMAHLSRWLEQKRLGIDDLTGEQLERFLRHRRRSGYTAFRSRRGLKPLMLFMASVLLFPQREAAPDPDLSAVGKILERYRSHLAERDLAQRTVSLYCDVARRFLSAHLGSAELSSLTAISVCEFVLKAARRFSVGTAKSEVTALRSLLRYLFMSGDLRIDLAASVPSVAGWRLASLPKGLPPGEVERLLESRDRRTHVGRRDYAVVLIMVRLGLRACEVAALTLDDVEWAHGEIIIHGKGGRDDRLPLPQDVGSALATYIRWSRPDVTTRRLFVRVRAPHGGLSSEGIKAIVSQCGHCAGISVSAHRLRHTAATAMLRHGAALSDIAQVLRHRSLDTTAIYAKVDRTALRNLVQPWPGGVA